MNDCKSEIIGTILLMLIIIGCIVLVSEGQKFKDQRTMYENQTLENEKQIANIISNR